MRYTPCLARAAGVRRGRARTGQTCRRDPKTPGIRDGTVQRISQDPTFGPKSWAEPLKPVSGCGGPGEAAAGRAAAAAAASKRALGWGVSGEADAPGAYAPAVCIRPCGRPDGCVFDPSVFDPSCSLPPFLPPPTSPESETGGRRFWPVSPPDRPRPTAMPVAVPVSVRRLAEGRCMPAFCAAIPPGIPRI